MSAQTVTQVRKALATAFAAGAFFDADKVQYENKTFVPPSAPWASFWFLPNIPVIASLGDEGFDEVTGILQIDLNWPLNVGETEPAAKADAIRNYFLVGSRFAVMGGPEVTIRAAGRGNGRIEGVNWRISVTISFYAQIKRQ